MHYRLTLTTPDAERIDVRGRQFAWLIAVDPIAILATIIFTISSGLTFIYPWVFTVIPALLGVSSRSNYVIFCI
ncbi:hypothetical protein ACT7DA_13840 [Bacillus pacificus]